MSSSFLKVVFVLSCTLQEGPHCALNEEEFYDAMEIGLERQEEQDEIVSGLSLVNMCNCTSTRKYLKVCP